jgi:hypothetical protein
MLTNRSAPPVTVTPVLVYPDVREAVAWLEAALGFEEKVRIGDAHRAQLRVGTDGAVVVTDAGADESLRRAVSSRRSSSSASRTSTPRSPGRGSTGRVRSRARRPGSTASARPSSRIPAVTGGS